VIIKKVRGRNGRIYKRRIVVGGSRRHHRGGRRTRRDTYTPSRTSTGSTGAVASAPIPRKPIGRPVIPEERAREIQAALKNAGYYQGEVTGNYDDATREAMRSFQRANGIKDTGMPTAPALLKLGLTKHKSEAGDTSAPSVTPPPPSQPDGTPNQ
jgi:peptidoglycan hydrolase-like protein with peptidoglycan-binding domain